MIEIPIVWTVMMGHFDDIITNLTKAKHCELSIELKALHLHDGHCIAHLLFHAFSFAISSCETEVSCDIFCC